MRRIAPPVLLVLLAVGCKSPEEKACDNTVPITEAALAASGRSDGKTSSEHHRACLESLRRLQHELQPDEDAWFGYLRCLRAATDLAGQSECLGPLTAAKPASP